MQPRRLERAPAQALQGPAARPDGHPQWARDLVAESRAAKDAVAQHEAWRLMREATISRRLHQLMLVGFWPLVARFPDFLALNLLKTSHGRDEAINAARAWLARNLRSETRHAEWYLDWAAALGLARDAVLDGTPPVEMTAIADWCWRVCHAAPLPEAMAATNYAVEGVTGDWVRAVAASEVYRGQFAASERESAMRWLDAHADYDAAHPFEALDIIVRLLGPDPAPGRVAAVRAAVLKSYALYRTALDVAQTCAAAERA